jgi:hypothetical protein
VPGFRSVTGRAYHFCQFVEGVRTDEELARKGPGGRPSVWFIHRECESRSLRQRWKKSGTDEDTALKAAAGLTVVGAIPNSSANIDVALVRYASDEVFMTDSCAFCKREVPTRGHHVVPRCKGGTEIVPTCHSCEDFIHKTWSHNELRDTFNTVETILADARFQKFLKWLHKQQDMAVFRSQRGRTRRPGKYR